MEATQKVEFPPKKIKKYPQIQFYTPPHTVVLEIPPKITSRVGYACGGRAKHQNPTDTLNIRAGVASG